MYATDISEDLGVMCEGKTERAMSVVDFEDAKESSGVLGKGMASPMTFVMVCGKKSGGDERRR